jgi:hypothetical protein
MENATKAIIIAAAVVITMAIVSFGFFIMNKGTEEAKKGVNEFGNMSVSMEESQYTMYDNAEESGSGVVSAIQKVKNLGHSVGIYVVTKGGDNWYVFDASNLDELEEAPMYVEDVKDSSTYINPAGRFKGKVERDINGRIASVTFTQQ